MKHEDDTPGEQDEAIGPASQLEVKPYRHAAGGLGAIKAVVREASTTTGLVAGMGLLTRVNQPNGFDCPGCAWPDPDATDRSAFEFCENGAKAVFAEATRHRVTPEFFKRWSVPELIEKSDHWLEAQGRLTHPMIRQPGEDYYQPIAWSEAFKTIADDLNALDSPNQAIFYTSGRTSNEAAFLYQTFARMFGTNNLPDCSNMCHESSGRGLTETIGIGKGTVSLQDFEHADLILVIGQNPGTNHPRMLTALQEAKRRGCKIISVNPLLERGLERFGHPQEPLALLGQSTALSDLYLQVRINGDVALLQGMMKYILAQDEKAGARLLDYDFIHTHTQGFLDWKAHLARVAWADIERSTGLTRALIEQAGDMYLRAESTIACWAMGLTQHKNGVANVQEVVNLLLLKGNFGRPGAGACPVRGHSNVQGDRTMGIVERPSEAFLTRLSDVLGFEAPRDHGFDTVESIHAMADGRAKIFMGMGGNFVAATPDTAYTESALRQCRLTVQVSTKLNRSHLVTGQRALILPCLGRTELDNQTQGAQFVTCENSMSVVTRSTGRRRPASSALMSEPAIVAHLADATLRDTFGLDWLGLITNYDQIRHLIEQVIPGFENYNERVRKPSGFVLPNGPRGRQWNTRSGRAEFSIHSMPSVSLAPGQYLMATIRSHDQYNTTIYGLDDRYRGVYGGRRIVMMNPEDIAAAGFATGDSVTITSHFEGTERHVHEFTVVSQPMPTQCVFTYFPEANPLIPAKSVADKSNTPTSKSIIVTIRRSSS
ncbi:MAG: FdhF/YdeP family oxidoreductase [Myxococcota bacterium]|nr:FdhF/YdeP family oxidoreductase [Myxococcota bacterium]